MPHATRRRHSKRPEVVASGDSEGRRCQRLTDRTSSSVHQPGGRSMKSHRTNRTRKCVRPRVESPEGRCLLSGVIPLPDTGPAAALVDVSKYHNDDSPQCAEKDNLTDRSNAMTKVWSITHVS